MALQRDDTPISKYADTFYDVSHALFSLSLNSRKDLTFIDCSKMCGILGRDVDWIFSSHLICMPFGHHVALQAQPDGNQQHRRGMIPHS